MSGQAVHKSRYILVSGGVGGAKFELGLSRVLAPEQLTIIANTGDDFSHLGLSISPDLDTLMYTLAGLVNDETGWGCRDETWSCMAALEALGGETWFRLGDRDLATHLERTRLLAGGQTLTAVTRHLCQRLGVGVELLPMSDAPVRTVVELRASAAGGAQGGSLPFQEYFVRRRAEPPVSGFRYEGATRAPPAANIAHLFTDPALAAVFIAPSNPFISIEPILAVPGMRDALAGCGAPVVAISPIIGGRAVKGPTAKIMVELGLPASAASIARHYGDLLDGFILDDADHAEAEALVADGLAVAATPILMRNLADRIRIAEFALGFAVVR